MSNETSVNMLPFDWFDHHKPSVANQKRVEIDAYFH